ncbi:hypothetical protein ACUXAV_004995 [Cupriavidus metallidurans]|uniref:hypothetical protein n=1 Tax=Cupriavidus TaxID=106589 RepID=UPI000B09A6BC|nr:MULTISPECIES: hypothetical protein [Cupriavidus]MCA3183491.1 hypothetical protein [Cupriavidus sp.]MCA3192181.1 hypothetical protein [Cupriavidus sp.]MCA3234606.1 hypothetical protein [Cupriavidus sp.]MDE4922624.1 hypothetical protein [Cupriavidus metallidurans]QWE98099.1 hypothetical protein KLP38_29965 [Cupriavidus sp. EM10]
MKDFNVTFTVSVTAGTPEEAARLALDDLRDRSLESWNADVEHQGERSSVTVSSDGEHA